MEDEQGTVDDRGLIEWRCWQIVAAVMRRGTPTVWPLQTWPMDGFYDCLALVDAAGNGRFSINRPGSIHTSRTSVPDWVDRCERDMDRLLRRIGSSSLDSIASSEQPIRTVPAYVADTIASALSDRTGRVFAVCDADGQLNRQAVEPYADAWSELERRWLTIDPPSSDLSPLAWVWAVELEGEPARLCNLATGELVRTDGLTMTLGIPPDEQVWPASLR